jgi:hypothetical protein
VKGLNPSNAQAAAESKQIAEKLYHLYAAVLNDPHPMFQGFGISPWSTAFAGIGVRAAIAGRYEHTRKAFAHALKMQERRELRMIGRELAKMERGFVFDEALAQKTEALKQALAQSSFERAVFLYIEIWMQLYGDRESFSKAMRHYAPRSFGVILWDLAEMLKLDIYIPFT